MKTGVGTLVVSLVIAGVVCAQEQPQPASRMPGTHAAGTRIVKTPPSSAPRILATYSLGNITERDLDRLAGIQLARLKMQEYELETKLIRQIVSERLLRFEAIKERKTRDELYAERVTSRIVEPPKERVDQLLKQYGGRIKGTPQEKRRKIVAALKQQQVRQLEDQLQASLLREANLKIFVAPPRFPVPIGEHDPVLGPSDAPVTIVEFTDFQCPYCQRAAGTVRELLKRYGSSLRLVFKAAPTPSHPRAIPAAEAALCAGRQGKFWAFYDWAFAHQDGLSNEAFTKEATALGLDTAKFSSCMSGHEELPLIQSTKREARQLGITGTPTFFINGRMLAGAQPASAFSAVIDNELAVRPSVTAPGKQEAPGPHHRGRTPNPGKTR